MTHREGSVDRSFRAAAKVVDVLEVTLPFSAESIRHGASPGAGRRYLSNKPNNIKTAPRNKTKRQLRSFRDVEMLLPSPFRCR